MGILIIILTILLGLCIWWLTTLGYIESPAGQTMMIAIFGKPFMVIGNTLPKVKITDEIIDLSKDELAKIQPRIDSSNAIVLKIAPMKPLLFDYRYKHFDTIKRIRETGGEIVWQPTIPVKDDGVTPVFKENSPDTIALGEWKEVNKRTIWLKERESIVIKFTSKDPIRGVKKGYIRYIIWDMTLATKSVRSSKQDVETKSIDMFQEWARTKDYFEQIQGIGFESVNHNGKSGKQFIKDLNKEIYETGIVVEGIDLTEDVIEPGSQDVYDAKEKKIKGHLLSEAAEIDAGIAKIEGEGIRDKQLAINEGEKNRLEIANNAEIDKDQRLKQNQVQQDKDLKANEIDQHNKNLENEKRVGLERFEKETEIAVSANGKIIDKIIEAKNTPDATTVKKAWNISHGSLVNYIEGNTGNTADTLDENLTSHVTGNLITLPKTKGGKQ